MTVTAPSSAHASLTQGSHPARRFRVGSHRLQHHTPKLLDGLLSKRTTRWHPSESNTRECLVIRSCAAPSASVSPHPARASRPNGYRSRPATVRPRPDITRSSLREPALRATRTFKLWPGSQTPPSLSDGNYGP